MTLDDTTRARLPGPDDEQTPERIMAWAWTGKRHEGQWQTGGLTYGTPYVRVDVFADALRKAEADRDALARALEAAEGEVARLREALATAGAIVAMNAYGEMRGEAAALAPRATEGRDVPTRGNQSTGE